MSADLTAEEVMALLAENPQRIAASVAGLTRKQLHAIPGEDQWSANDVLAHLRSCADVWGGVMRRMIEEDEPTIRVVSPRGWTARTNYLELEFRVSFGAFTAQRDDLLGVLSSLSASDWARTATVKRSGKETTETVLSYGERLAVHERHHLEQFTRIAAVVGA